MSLLKKLASQTAIYGISSILVRMINFLLVPFYTAQAVMNATSMGVMTELYADIAFLNILFLLGLETTYFRFATKKTISEQEAFNTSLSTIILSSLLLSGSLIIFSSSIADLLRFEGKGIYYILMGLILGIDAISAIPFARLRLEEKAGKFAFIKVVNILFNVFFNVFFLVFCKKIYEGKLLIEWMPAIKTFYNPEWTVEYVLLANLLASLSSLLLLLGSFYKFKLTFNWAVVKPMFIYSMPLMFLGFAGMIDEMASRKLLRYLLPEGFYPEITNTEALGIFGACYKLSMFMAIAIQAFRYAADPFFFSQSSDKNAPELYAKVMKWFIIVAAFIFLSIGANLSIIQYFLRSEIYRTGVMIVPVLLLANLFSGIYYNLSVWYKLTDRTQYGLYITLTGAAITIIFNILLVPIFGYMGSAITTLICYLCISSISFYFGQKYYPIPYNLVSAFGYILLAAALIYLALLYPFGKETILSYGFQLILMLIYLAVVFLFEKGHLKFRKS